MVNVSYQEESWFVLVQNFDKNSTLDKTYFCVKTKDTLVGCGGWSMRSTLYGGNHSKNRDKKLLDPMHQISLH